MVAQEPEHRRLWWWQHDIGLAATRHEKAELLRRAMSAESGGVYFRDGVRLNIEHMSDDEVIALDHEMREEMPFALPPPDIAGATDSSWGWRNSPAYNKALEEFGQPGTHETINGRVPTIEEARRMIEESGGTYVRLDPAHDPNGVSTHTRPHINYETKRGKKATVYVRGR